MLFNLDVSCHGYCLLVVVADGDCQPNWKVTTKKASKKERKILQLLCDGRRPNFIVDGIVRGVKISGCTIRVRMTDGFRTQSDSFFFRP